MEQHFVTGILKYNPEKKRFGLYHENRFMNDGFYNEDKLQVFVDQRWVPTAIWKTQDGRWALKDLRFTEAELEGLQARITKTTSPGGFDYLSQQKVKWIYHEEL